MVRLAKYAMLSSIMPIISSRKAGAMMANSTMAEPHCLNLPCGGRKGVAWLSIMSGIRIKARAGIGVMARLLPRGGAVFIVSRFECARVVLKCI